MMHQLLGEKMSNILVSIIMPVYNAEQDLREAIDSILNQTHTNLEVLIINDASTDSSVDIIKSYTDKRIRFINNETNLRQSRTRNKGLQLARGKYIANMDADDISLPTRIAEQVAYMETHPDVDICGTAYKSFGGKRDKYTYFPEENKEIFVTMMTASAVAHPTIMFRKSSVEKYNIQYSVEAKYAQDFELWTRLLFQGVKFHNINKVLFHYRLSPNGIGRKHGLEQKMIAWGIIRRNLNKVFGERVHLKSFNSCESLDNVKEDLGKLATLYQTDVKSEYFSTMQCKKIIRNIMVEIANTYAFYGIPLWMYFIRTYPCNDLISIWSLKLLVKSVIKYDPINLHK